MSNEFPLLELSDLLEAPSRAIEGAVDKLIETAEGSVESVVGAGKELGEQLIKEGREVAESFIKRGFDVLEESGLLEDLRGLVGAGEGLLNELSEGVRRLAELEPEQLVLLAAVIGVAAFAPETLLANAGLLGGLLASG